MMAQSQMTNNMLPCSRGAASAEWYVCGSAGRQQQAEHLPDLWAEAAGLHWALRYRILMLTEFMPTRELLASMHR